MDWQRLVQLWDKENLSFRVKVGELEAPSRTLYLTRISYLSDWLGQTGRAQISPADAEDFRAHLIERGLAVSTANHALATARIFCKHQIRRGRLAGPNPFAGINIKPNQRARAEKLEESALSFAQAVAAIKATPEEQYRACFALMAATGMRPGEALGLKLGDLQQNKEKGTLEAEVEPSKGHGRRKVLLIDRALEKMVRHFAARRRKEELQAGRGAEGRLFTLAYSSLANYCNYKLSERVGFRVKPHGFRFAFAMRCYELAATKEDVQRLMGHSWSTTTDWYQVITKMELPERVYALRDYDPRTDAPLEGKSGFF